MPGIAKREVGETDDDVSSDEGLSSNDLEGESDTEGRESEENDSESDEKDNAHGEEREFSHATLFICSYSSIGQLFRAFFTEKHKPRQAYTGIPRAGVQMSS